MADGPGHPSAKGNRQVRPREVVVLSGKGGTGKTSVLASLAHLAAQEMCLVLADADVDAANLELVVGAEVQRREEFRGGQVAVVDAVVCTACGRCAEVCRFGAVLPGEPYTVDEVLCEGCRVCLYECPAGAVRMEESLDGYWFVSRSRYGWLIHGALRAGRENSGKLVSLVKKEARRMAKETEAELLLVDGPPGIGCPAIASFSGADLALVVTEPTVAGVHDLERVVALARHFAVPLAVCLNKADLSATQRREVERFCSREEIAVAGSIPFDHRVVAAMLRGRPVTADGDGPAAQAIRRLWETLRALVEV
ncbi:MAG: ATP-binding protein [Chloroflexia bacterium]